MARDGWQRATIAIVATTLRTRYRRARSRPKKFALQVLLFGGPILFLLSPMGETGGAARAGRRLREAGIEALLPTLQGMSAAAWLGVVLFSALTVRSSVDDGPGGEGVVRAAGVRATLLGSVLAENVRRVAFFGWIVLAGLISFARGAGSGLPVPAGFVAMISLVVSATAVGMVLGLGTLDLLARDRRLWRLRGLVGGAGVGVAAVAVVFHHTTLPLLAGFPLGWYANLFLAGIPGIDANAARGWAIVAASWAVVVPAYFATERLADRVWFTDPGDEGLREVLAGLAGTRGSAGDGLTSWLAPVTARPTRAIVRRLWLQMRRNLGKLYLAGLPVVLGGLSLLEDDPSSTLPVSLAVYAGWGVGLGATLNPLSLEGPGLPTLLASPVEGRRVVRAQILAGALIALPLGLAGVFAAAYAAGSPPSIVAGAVAVTVVLVVAGATLSVAVGLALPALQAMAPVDVDAMAAPDRYSALAYSVGFAVVAAPAAIGLYPGAGARLGLPTGPLRAAGVGGTIVLAAVVGGAAYRYAAREFRTVTVE